MNAKANIPPHASNPGRSPESSMRDLSLVGGCLLLALLAGCAENPYVLQRQVQAEQQQKLAVTQQAEELKRQVQTLDQDNRELQTMLAQSRQQSQVMQDQLTAMREQLSGAAGQM